MTAADTSVVVAGFASWHEGHEAALSALAREPRLPAQVLLESYSVLTRLPPPHRTSSTLAGDFLRARFPGPPLGLSGRRLIRLLERAVAADLAGGTIYDALVAETARAARATLLTRDRRAVPVYELVGTPYELID